MRSIRSSCARCKQRAHALTGSAPAAIVDAHLEASLTDARVYLAVTSDVRLMQNFYHRAGDDVRVTVLPTFMPEHSDPDEPRYVFAYHIRIENIGDRTAQLLWRHWYIHDEAEGDSEVEGEGVIGEQPVLAPGDVHEYESFCVLKGPRGWMEGFYEFRRPDGTAFRGDIPRFELEA